MVTKGAQAVVALEIAASEKTWTTERDRRIDQSVEGVRKRAAT